jgi:predicted RNA-binding protein (virulence factor B family)
LAEVTVLVDQEVAVTVTAVLAWGVAVVTQDGERGFIDSLKIPAESDEVGFPEVGDSLRAVVLDDSRTPFRGSLLREDFSLARQARTRGR